jgi:hypothetical protein
MRPSKIFCPCRNCGQPTIIKQQKTYVQHGPVHHRLCNHCGYQWRNRVERDGTETYLSEIRRRNLETFEMRQRYKDMLFRLERSGKTPVEVLEKLREAGVKMGLIL